MRLSCSVALSAASLLVLPCTPLAAQNTQELCEILVGGGFIRVHDYDVVFTATGDSIGSTIHGLVIVRASPQFRTLRTRAALQLSRGGGAAIGPLWIQRDDATNTVWIDSLSVPLKPENNVLLVGVDAREIPAIEGEAWIEPRVSRAAGRCDDSASLERYRAVSDTLWQRFQASALIRSFVSR